MMKKKIDSPFRKLKVLLVLPLVAMVFYAFAKPEYVSTTPAFPTDKVNVSADGNDVKGKVVKTDGKPLHGTSVIVTGTTIGTIADVDGNFKLNSVPKDAKIAFSFVGFKTVMQNPDFGQPMTITMVTDTVKFEKGVVAVGYSPLPTGKTEAGSGAGKVNIDSDNPPLYIVDGKMLEKGAFEKINPNTDNIESINVLKDKKATDKYGEKGKNGVLEITMKNSHSVLTPAPQFETLHFIKLSDIHPENTPLIYLDNVIIDKAKLKEINPDSISSVQVLKGKEYIDRDGDKAKNGIIVITSLKKEAEIKQGIDNAQYFVDGAEITKDELAKIDPNKIESINVLKGEEAIKKYGEKGHEGVIEIKLKSANGTSAVAPKEVNDVKVVGYGDSPKQQNEREVFVVVEQMPEFPGGDQACKDFIARNLRYPDEAIKNGLVGKVLVTFLVNKDGKIEYAKVVIGADPSLNNEAVRVVSSMPDWKPGKQRGKAVDVAYTMPIEFMLQ